MSPRALPEDDRPVLILVRDGATGEKWFDVAYYEPHRRAWRFYRDSLTYKRGEGVKVEWWRYCHETIEAAARGDQATISRDALETLVEAASGCGAVTCWWHGPPMSSVARYRAEIVEAVEAAKAALGEAAP